MTNARRIIELQKLAGILQVDREIDSWISDQYIDIQIDESKYISGTKMTNARRIIELQKLAGVLQVDKQIDRQLDDHTYRQIDRLISIQIDESKYISGTKMTNARRIIELQKLAGVLQVDRQKDSWISIQTDRQMNPNIYLALR